MYRAAHYWVLSNPSAHSAGPRVRVLYVSPVFPPEEGSESFANAKLAVALARAGAEVHVLSAAGPLTPPFQFHKLWGPLAEAVSEHTSLSSNSVVSHCKGAALETLRLRTVGIVGLPWAYLARCLLLTQMEQKKYQIDLIWSRSSGTGHLLAMHLRDLLRVPWIASFNDPEPFETAPSPYARPMSYRSRAMVRVTRRVLHAADCLTFPTSRLANYILDYNKVTRNNGISIIPHIGLFESLPPSRPGGRGRPMVILHAGNMVHPRDAGPLLHALARGVGQGLWKVQDLKFAWAGKADGVLSKARELGIENCIEIRTPVPHAEVHKLLREADVLLLVEAEMREGIFLPGKFTDYVTARRPILALSPADGAVHDILLEAGGGFVYHRKMRSKFNELSHS